MTQEEKIQLAAEFMGLKRCKIYEDVGEYNPEYEEVNGWEFPDGKKRTHLFYDSNFNDLILLYLKCKEVIKYSEHNGFVKRGGPLFVQGAGESILENRLMDAFDELIYAILWYNENKQYIKQ